MKQFENLSFEILHETDLTILTPIMERAFDEDTRIHLNKPKGGPAGYDNGDFLRRFGLHPNSTSYKISMDGKPIGSIILWLNHDTNIHFLGNIFIDPSLQNKGIGLKIWNFIEKQYPNTLKWCTDTPGFSKRNHHFYVNKCGFHLVKLENPMKDDACQYILEKTY